MRVENRVVRVVGADGFARYIIVTKTWQWLYLAWTFRNFSQLPETVLSRGQRHLLRRMCSHISAEQRVDSWHVMGTIELPAKSCEFFRNSPQMIASESHIKAAKKPETGIARRAAGTATSARMEETKVLREPVRGQSRSGHRTAAAVCVLLLVVATYAWQRLADPGYVQPTVAVSKLADLTRPTVAAAQMSAPAQAAPHPAASLETTASTLTTPQESPTTKLPGERAVAQLPAAAASQVAAAPAPGVLGPGASASTAKMDPVKTAELHAPVATAAEIASAPKPVEETRVSMPAIESLRQDARPKALLYPPAGNRTGKVVLGLTVRADGAVDSVQVVSGDRALAKAAAETVKYWRFQPTSGEQFKSVVTVTFMGADAVMVRFPTQAELAGR
jgi:TonB family protein